MRLKKKNIGIAQTLNNTKNDFVWILYYKIWNWDFTISNRFSKMIYFETKEETLKFKKKLLRIEISLYNINFFKKEIYIDF